MNQDQIKKLQQATGSTPDGFWGPKSIAACQAHLRSLMPSPNPWPKSDQASLQAFYGSPGDENKHTIIDVSGLGMLYENTPVKQVRCHSKVAASLLRVLTAISKLQEGAKVLAEYAGVYNNRSMRGGSSPSLHARAAAIDLDPDSNANLTSWPAKATMPLAVIECFAREGWLSAGAFWGRDAMHFQATS